MVGVGDHLYVLGGSQNTIERLDGNAGKFVVVGDMPPKCRTSAAVLDTQVLMAGGGDNSLIVFDTQANSVTTNTLQLFPCYWQTYLGLLTVCH